MQFKTIADIYAANDKIRERLIATISNLTEEQENLPSENGRWTLGAVVEHLTKVEESMMRICQKLLSKSEAEGKTSDGTANLSESFIESTGKAIAENLKFEAPEFVHPEGGKPIAGSLQLMEQTRAKLNDMRPMFETIEGTSHTFPHPAFGNMNAHDWLVLIGGHETRHTAQIKRILAQNNDR